MSTLSSQLGLRLTSLCDSLEKEVIGRCVKIYRFEPHPRRKVLIIVGEVTITIVVPVTGKVSKQWTEEFRKSVHLLGLTRTSKIDKISRDVLTTYPYIDESMSNKLQEAIEEIKQRNYDHNGIVIVAQVATDGSFLPRYPEIFDEFDMTDGLVLGTGDDDEPDFGKLEEYVEQLYEDIPQKIEASTNISKLTKFNSYLHDIARHESAVNALFRTLREDSKKSTHLTKNILRICLDFAKVKEFQPVLIKQKIPQLTLDIIDFELERCEKWKAQVNLLEEAASTKPAGSRALSEYHLMFARLDELTNAQNSLLKVAFEILHCVSEKAAIRKILLRQRVIISLVDAMDRKNNDLLEVILLYLKDMASFKEGIGQMVIAEVVDKLAKILKGGVPIPRKAVNSSLHLLYNLSFHNGLRERISKCGLISVLANCFEKSSFQDISGKTLYLLSMDPNLRNKLAKSSLVNTLMSQLTASHKESIPLELGCLAVNLARNKRCVDLIWESNQVGKLIKNAMRNEDVLAMKIVRNLAEQEAVFVLYECLTDISAAVAGSSAQEFVTECIGTLACFDPYRVNIEEITQKGRIFPWLKQTLGYYIDLCEKGCSELDLIASIKRAVTEVVLLLGNLCKCEEGARLIVGEGFAELLMKILHLRDKDHKLFQQILYLFNKCTEHESISVFFALKTRIPSGLLEFAESSAGNLKQLCESVLQRIGAFDDTWKENVQQYNFLSWNKDWTDAITMEEIEQEDEDSRAMAGMSFEDFQTANKHSDSAMLTESFAGSSDSDTEVDQSRWSSGNSGNDSDHVPSGFFGLFKQQFEEEMALQQREGFGDLDLFENSFDYDSESESGWV